MRSINEIIVHCSATMPTMDIGVAEIDRWHKDRGWSGIGYHYVIRRDGSLETGRDISRAGAHVSGRNANSIGVCIIGGIDKEGKSETNFTLAQWGRLVMLLNDLKEKYPGVLVRTHNEFANKDCPTFILPNG